jgi:hypothetical protein
MGLLRQTASGQLFLSLHDLEIAQDYILSLWVAWRFIGSLMSIRVWQKVL